METNSHRHNLEGGKIHSYGNDRSRDARTSRRARSLRPACRMTTQLGYTLSPYHHDAPQTAPLKTRPSWYRRWGQDPVFLLYYAPDCPRIGANCPRIGTNCDKLYQDTNPSPGHLARFLTSPGESWRSGPSGIGGGGRILYKTYTTPVVWGTGRGCLRSLHAPRRFQGGWPLRTLLDLRCLWSLGWGSRRWSAFGRGT